MRFDDRHSVGTGGGIPFPGFKHFHRQSGKLPRAATRESVGRFHGEAVRPQEPPREEEMYLCLGKPQHH